MTERGDQRGRDGRHSSLDAQRAVPSLLVGVVALDLASHPFEPSFGYGQASLVLLGAAIGLVVDRTWAKRTATDLGTVIALGLSVLVRVLRGVGEVPRSSTVLVGVALALGLWPYLRRASPQVTRSAVVAAAALAFLLLLVPAVSPSGSRDGSDTTAATSALQAPPPATTAAPDAVPSSTQPASDGPQARIFDFPGDFDLEEPPPLARRRPPCTIDRLFCDETEVAGLADSLSYGRGASFADINGDGWDDLWVANSDLRFRGDDFEEPTLHLNAQDGTFRTVPLDIDPEALFMNWGATFADFDNDTDQDVLVVNGGYAGDARLVLLENRLDAGEGFVDVSSGALPDRAQTTSAWWGASWADYDQDGHLDLAVTRRIGTTIVLRNDGQGGFTEEAQDLDMVVVHEDGKNPVWLDYDNDGDPDLYVAGMVNHALYENRGAAGFTEVTDSWIPPSIDDVFPGVFAAATADFDQDGIDDLYLGRWSLQDIVLLGGGRRPVEIGADDGLDMAVDPELLESRQMIGAEGGFENTMGLGIGDLDGNGHPDVLLGTGDPTRAAPDLAYCARAGTGQRRVRFEPCDSDLTDHGVSRGHGAAMSDVDRDGDVDVFWNLGGFSPWDQFSGWETRESNSLKVRQREAPNAVSVKLIGTTSARDGVGARLTATDSEGRTMHLVVHSMQGFQSQNSLVQTIPITSPGPVEISVLWPSGREQQVRSSAGERMVVVEP